MADGFARESVTVDNTGGGVALTVATFAPTGGIPADHAFLTVETAQIRFTYDGTAPTTTLGHLAEPGDVIKLDSAQSIKNFLAIRTGGVSGILQVTYERGGGLGW